MAITDNNFTQEEFNAAIEANPDLLQHVTPALESREYIVQDKDTHTNYLNTKREEFAKTLTKTHAEKIESDVLELTGIEKENPDEKYYEYMKRAISLTKKNVEQMQTELADLKKGVKPSEQDKARIEQLEKALSQKDKDFDDFKKSQETEISKFKLQSKGQQGLAAIRNSYKPDYPKSLVTLAEEKAVSDLMDTSEMQEDGTVIFRDAEGNVRMNTKTYKPLTFAEALSEHDAIKELIDPSKVKTGAGTKAKEDEGGEKAKGEKGEFVRLSSVPAEVTTKTQLTAHMMKLGYVQGSKEMNEDFAKFGKDLKLR